MTTLKKISNVQNDTNSVLIWHNVNFEVPTNTGEFDYHNVFLLDFVFAFIFLCSPFISCLVCSFPNSALAHSSGWMIMRWGVYCIEGWLDWLMDEWWDQCRWSHMTFAELEHHAAFLCFSFMSFENWCANLLNYGESSGTIAIVWEWMVVEIDDGTTWCGDVWRDMMHGIRGNGNPRGISLLFIRPLKSLGWYLIRRRALRRWFRHCLRVHSCRDRL